MKKMPKAVPKKLYHRPQLKEWGTVATLTKTGLTMPGNDDKAGSVLTKGG